jgi:hypothetical protein
LIKSEVWNLDLNLNMKWIHVFSGLLLLANTSLAQVFTERAVEMGLSHVQIEPRLFGGGVAVIDANNDGYEDLYFTGGVREDWLFINNKNGGFERELISSVRLATRIRTTIGVLAADFNNDGFEDLLVYTDQRSNNLLFKNLGNGDFVEVSEAAGLTEAVWSMGATVIDVNLDGLLDIYLANYIRTPSVTLDSNGKVTAFNHDCYGDLLYINNGNFQFTESSSTYLSTTGCGLAVTTSDINGDNIPDIYVANDFGEWVTPNLYFENDVANGRLVEKASEFSLDVQVYGMGIATGDYDRDGLFDYYVTSIGRNALLKSTHDGQYIRTEGIANADLTSSKNGNSTSWGALFFDANNDGWEDLAVANGYISSADFLNTANLDPSVVLENTQNGAFRNLSTFFDPDSLQRSRAVVSFDYDKDGDLDLVFSNVVIVSPSQGNHYFFVNELQNDNNWLRVSLRGIDQNSFGLGAKLNAYNDGSKWMRELSIGGTHASSSSKIVHFGLGELNQIDSLELIWPGGVRQVFSNVMTNNHLKITQGASDLDYYGCTNQSSENYNPLANLDDNSCKIVTSTDEIEPIAKLKLLNNPIETEVILYYEMNSFGGDISYAVFNLNGEIVDSADLVPKNGQYIIGTQNWSSGFYFLSLANAQGVKYHFKLLKK